MLPSFRLIVLWRRKGASAVLRILGSFAIAEVEMAHLYFVLGHAPGVEPATVLVTPPPFRRNPRLTATTTRKPILTAWPPAGLHRVWRGGRYGYGQVLLVSGHPAVLTEDGDALLVRAAPDKLQDVARFTALQGKTWNIPGISDGLLLVRNEVEMAAFRIAAD